MGEQADRQTGCGEGGRDVPGGWDAVGVELAYKFGLVIACFEWAPGDGEDTGGGGDMVAGALGPGMIAAELFVGLEESAEAVFGLVGVAEFGGEAGGGALGGGGRIIELVREIGGELAEGEELFGLLVHAREVADAIEQEGDAALADGGDDEEHRGEEILMNVGHPAGANAAAVGSPRLHAGVGQLSGERGGPADEVGDGTGVAAGGKEPSPGNDVHGGGGV